MANGRIYYYPDAGGSIERLDLGRPLAQLQEVPFRHRVTSYAGDGSPYVATWAGGRRVRVVCRALSASVIRSLEGVQNHLQRGGAIGVSRDHSKSWFGFGVGVVSRGDTVYATGGNAFTAYSTTATLASGDEVCMETPNPEWISELGTVSSLSAGGDVTLTDAKVITDGSPGTIRYRDFYPALRLPDDAMDKPIIVTETRIQWTLDMMLEVDPAVFDLAGTATRGVRAATADLGLADGSSAAGSQYTIDQVLARSRSGHTPSHVPSRFMVT